MKYFDLHCDTICECYEKSKTLTDNGLHVDLNKTDSIGTYFQCCAAWIPDKYKGESAWDYFLKLRSQLDNAPTCTTKRQLEHIDRHGGIGLIPTAEGGSVLGDSIEKIYSLVDAGVKMLTLTWNSDNKIGGGISGENTGLTDFGRDVIVALEDNDIIIDVSHASIQLFDDICNYSAKPFVASHSNARKLCGHKRNLSDEQINEIILREGLIGVNFYVDFLENNPKKASITSIIKQIEYFLELGAKDCLSFGGDFDGSDIPTEMTGIDSIPHIQEELIKLGYSYELLDKIFYRNAYEFMKNSFTL